jgi:hypothetical protein
VPVPPELLDTLDMVRAGSCRVQRRLVADLVPHVPAGLA